MRRRMLISCLSSAVGYRVICKFSTDISFYLDSGRKVLTIGDNICELCHYVPKPLDYACHAIIFKFIRCVFQTVIVFIAK